MNLRRTLILPTEWHPLLDAALSAGWSVEKTNGGHIRWRPPSGRRQIFTASTPSDRRALYNARSLLRREGLVV